MSRLARKQIMLCIFVCMMLSLSTASAAIEGKYNQYNGTISLESDVKSAGPWFAVSFQRAFPLRTQTFVMLNFCLYQSSYWKFQRTDATITINGENYGLPFQSAISVDGSDKMKLIVGSFDVPYLVQAKLMLARTASIRVYFENNSPQDWFLSPEIIEEWKTVVTSTREQALKK